MIVGSLAGSMALLPAHAGAQGAPPAAAEVNPQPPAATTQAATAIGRTGATLNAQITPRGADTSYFFEYGTTTSYGLNTPAVTIPAGNDPVNVNAAITGLTKSTTYHFRILAVNAAGGTYGKDQTFSTTRKPAVTTSPASEITGASALVGATIDPQGEATTYRIQWGLTKNLGRFTTRKPLPSATGSQIIVEQLTNLKPNRKYYYRATATNAVGTTHGEIRTFTTPRELTSLSLFPDVRKVGWGGKVRVSGSLLGSGTDKVKVNVMRLDYPFTGEPWRVARATTNSAGNFRVTVGPLYATTRLYAVTDTPQPIISETLKVGGMVKTSLRVDKRRAKEYRLRGLVYPRELGPDAVVSVQRQTPRGRWVRVSRETLEPAGKSQLGFRAWVPRVKGRTAIYRFVVLPRNDGKNETSESVTVAVPSRR